MFENPVEKVWVNAARGGAASGKESEPFAMKSAVEMGAIILVLVLIAGGRMEGIVARISSVVGVAVGSVDVVAGVKEAGGGGGAVVGMAAPGSGSGEMIS
jgi:hypothetical protein